MRIRALEHTRPFPCSNQRGRSSETHQAVCTLSVWEVHGFHNEQRGAIHDETEPGC